jgi:hypothetical protein
MFAQRSIIGTIVRSILKRNPRNRAASRIAANSSFAVGKKRRVTVNGMTITFGIRIFCIADTNSPTFVVAIRPDAKNTVGIIFLKQITTIEMNAVTKLSAIEHKYSTIIIAA